MQNILSGFLTAGLLPIGEDDEKLSLLESAAAELAKQIKSAPLLAHRFTLVGLDARVPASDPVHTLAEKAVFDKWQTITNKIGPSPVQVYRAVILRAIEIAAAENTNLSFAVTLIAASQSAGVAGGKEQTAIASMLARFDESGSKELTDIWVNTVDLSFPKLAAKVKKPQLNKDELSSGLSRAVGPTDKEGKAQTNPNPHWPNTGQPWSNEFVSRATDAISSAFQGAAKGFLDEMQESVREAVQGLVKGVDRMAIRDAKSELLWIRSSLYSPSAGRSYRKLDPNELLLHAVLDTSRAVKSVAPPSVAFFLRELVGALCDKKVRLAETLAVIGPKMATLPEAQLLLSDTLGATGRRGLLDCAIRSNIIEPFEQQTGLKDSYQEGLPDLAVRVYTELQILKLLSITS